MKLMSDQPGELQPIEPEVAVSPNAVRLRGVSALKLHLSLLIGVALCALAFRFELSRALQGNSLSWAYVGEWPLFAGFGVYFWWFLLHGRERRIKKEMRTVAPEYADMAQRWQAHQRDLAQEQMVPEQRSNEKLDGELFGVHDGAFDQSEDHSSGEPGLSHNA